MTVMLETSNATGFRDPRALLNACRPYVTEKTYNVFEGMAEGEELFDREVKLLLRDNVMTRDMAERIMENAIAYTITAIERPDVHLGVGKIVDIGVHQLYLDTPVLFAFFALHNGSEFKHHAPLITRRRDGLVLRTADFLRANGFAVDEELWNVDGADCSPCDDKVPDSH
ncbi:hypothetical protein ACFV0R_23305 [Streptomyces sp. NPDC059578]|uniref:hypothetical protein n=1 Tax=unclassified Streptomyces TaxID=2593676 RepID=UPI003657912F